MYFENECTQAPQFQKMYSSSSIYQGKYTIIDLTATGSRDSQGKQSCPILNYTPLHEHIWGAGCV
jgi:hypothetical protein